MKKISVSICVYLWTILLCVSIPAQDFKTVQDGIEYAEMTREIDKTPVKINLLRLDLTKVRVDVVHALDSAIGAETVFSMAERHGALAAINAGFFRLDKSIFAGDSAGVLVIDNSFLSESANNRTALEIVNLKDKTMVFIEKVDATAIFIVHTDPPQMPRAPAQYFRRLDPC
jgi:exopolysaccharide biosynthesis protein